MSWVNFMWPLSGAKFRISGKIKELECYLICIYTCTQYDSDHLTLQMNNCLVRSNYSIRPRWTRIIHQAKQVVDDFWQKFPFNYFFFFLFQIESRKRKNIFHTAMLNKEKTDGLHLWIGKQLTLSHDTQTILDRRIFFGLWMLWDLSKRGKVLYPNVCKDMQKHQKTKMFSSRTNNHWYRLFIKAGCTYYVINHWFSSVRGGFDKET